jgi:L-lactate dehydrogenase complex protein LldE
MEIDLFIPCFIDQFYPQTERNTRKILEKAGIKVNFNKKQTCCGQPLFNSGYRKQALPLAEKFLKDFPQLRLVVSPSASCAGYVRNYFPKLSDKADFRDKHAVLKSNLYELTDFLVNIARFVDFGAVFPAKVTWHDACSALREYGIKKEPRELLAHVAGLELLEMKDTEVCCGFGGTFSVKIEPISIAMAKQKVENALETGAEYIASTEASCLMHLDAYIRKHNLPIKTIHIADILASGW